MSGKRMRGKWRKGRKGKNRERKEEKNRWGNQNKVENPKLREG